MIDCRISKNQDGVFDIEIDETNGDFSTTEGLDTSIKCSILCYSRADESEVNKSFSNNGFAGDENNRYEIGSKLWLLKQARTNTLNSNRAKDFVLRSLDWLTSEGYSQSIEAVSSVTINGIIIDTEIKNNRNSSKNTIKIWNDTVDIE